MTSALKLSDLTPRQRDVLACVARGMTNQQIASRWGIVAATVSSHLSLALDRIAPEVLSEDRREAAVAWFNAQPAGERSAVTTAPRLGKARVPLPVRIVPPARKRLDRKRDVREKLQEWADIAVASSGRPERQAAEMGSYYANMLMAFGFVPDPEEAR